MLCEHIIRDGSFVLDKSDVFYSTLFFQHVEFQMARPAGIQAGGSAWVTGGVVSPLKEMERSRAGARYS